MSKLTRKKPVHLYITCDHKRRILVTGGTVERRSIPEYLHPGELNTLSGGILTSMVLKVGPIGFQFNLLLTCQVSFE